MEILPTLPDLDSSSSDGSVASIASVDDDNDDNDDNNNDQRLEVEEGDDDDDVANDDDVDDDDDEQNNDTSTETTATTTSPKSPTRIKSIKPGGEDNEPIQPRRSISPVYSNSESSSKSTKQQQQQKAAATTLTRLANPLDAFDKSPETSPIKNGKNNKTTKKQNNINNKGKDEGEGNDATPVSEGDSIINNKKKEATTIPGLGGPPLTNNNNNNKNNKKGGGPSLTLRRMPQRSNLKKSSSFNVGDKKQHLRSALQQMSRITQNNNKTTNNNPNENTNNNESEDDNATGTGTGTTGESTNSINTGGGGAAAAGSNKKQSLRRGEPTRGVLRCSSMPVRARKPTMIEVRVRGERFPVQRHRHINFHQRVEIKEVEPVPEMVDGNCSDIWLQEEDFVKMKEDRRNVVRQIKKQQLLLQQQQQQQQDDSSTSHHSQQQNQQNNNNYRPGQQPQLSPEQASKLRGLEKYVDRSIRAQKNMAWDTVLLEQDEQELSGDYNDERIADLYRHTTRESPNKAMTRAKQDEQEVQDYLWSPRTTKLLFRHKQVTSSPNTATSNNNNNNDHTATAAAKAKATVGFKTTIEGGLVAGPPKIAASDIMSTAENAEAAKNAAAPMAPPMMPEPATTTTTSPPTSTTTTTSSSASAITAPEAVPPMVRF